MTLKSQFHRYAETLASLPSNFADVMGLPHQLRMTGDHRHEVFYAPFDHVTTSARIVLVGITPGRTQAVEAIAVARRALLDGTPHDQAAAAAKVAASFSGPLRKNLVEILDHVGVADRLNIPTTGALWSSHAHLVHFTSALRYPVFENGKDFSGGGLMRSRFLVSEVESWFATECRVLTGAMFVPLGSAALAACQHMVTRGDLRATQILEGMPHPSGANAERIAYFLGRKPRSSLSAKTRADRLDAGRAIALKRVEGWS